MLQSEERRHRQPLLPQRAHATTDAQRPVDQPPFDPGRLAELGGDGGVDLLVHPRDAREDRRPHPLERLGDGVGIRAVRQREAEVRAEQVHQPPEVVRQREVHHHHVPAADVVVHLPHGVGHRVVVAVADHAGLGWPGRARGVDVREQVLRVDRRRGLFHGARMQLRVLAAAGPEIVEVAEREHVLRRRLAELRALLLVLAENRDRVGVLDDVRDVFGRAVHVDRGADRADEAEREVEQRPFEPRRGEDRERVALSDPEREQAMGELVHRLGGVVPRDRAPLAALLDQVGGPLPAARPGVLPEARDRPRGREARFGGRFSLDRHWFES